jgi:alpha-2-macroglobulin
LQVRSPFRQALAWVNVMRAGAIVDTLLLPINGTSPSIAVPIKASYAPNVFINVLAVRPRVAEPGATALVDLARPAFKIGLVHLDVSDESLRLQVKVNTDKVAYQSRETAKVAVQVSAGAGQTLSAEREVTVFAIDEALLELLPNNSWDVLKTMMAQRGYGFESASAAMQVIGKRHYGRKALPAGGGGGKSAARELFDTLLLWKGVVPLDAQGQAKVDIPINDSLTRFRVVVVANAGTSQFGLGMTSFVATKDLQVLSGLPATVREGDRFTAGFTIRNTTSLPLQVKLNASLNKVNLPEQALALKPLEARVMVWPVDVPQEVSELDWQVEATAPTANGVRQDRLVVKQSVSPALMPVRYTIMGQSVPQAAEPAIAIIKPPVGSQLGKGQLRISFSPEAATDASGVRDYMRSYPFYCLEQRTSKAVSLKDKALWAVISGSIDQYVTDSGLVNYYPNQNGYDGGYDVLTAYVLSAAHQAGWQLPEDAQKRMLDGLEQFVRGKLERHFSYYQDDGYALTERKLLALEAIARYRKPPAALAESLKLNPEVDLPKLSNRAVVQWIDILNRVEWPQKKVAMGAALAELDKRVVADPSSGALHLKHREGDEKWYLMYSRATDEVRAALLALDVPQLAGKADGLARGAVQLQRGGAAWWDTQANVWGSLLLDQRAARAQPATGITTVAVGKTIVQHDWSKAPSGSEHLVPARVANVPNGNAVAVLHRGTGKPFVLVTGNTWHELAKGDQKNASLEKTIKPIKRQTVGQWTAGDIAEVQIKFKASGAGWVVINDPIVPGATVLGNGLKGQAKVETADARRGYRNEDGSYEAWPSYVERTFTHVRAYYEYLWNDPMTLTYQVRINNAGQFKMPPTQLEAMYDPTTFANLPNPSFEVK